MPKLTAEQIITESRYHSSGGEGGNDEPSLQYFDNAGLVSFAEAVIAMSGGDLRDQFAMAALTGLLHNGIKTAAYAAYECAGHMMNARGAA